MKRLSGVTLGVLLAGATARAQPTPAPLPPGPPVADQRTPEQLRKEVLDRIALPSFADIPDREAMARAGLKRWRLPDTEIDLVLIENGPHAGEYLVSAETVDRLPEFYHRVKSLPYRGNASKELSEVYRA